MSIELRRFSELSLEQVSHLENAMADFYRNPPPEYYRTADQSSGHYTAGELPFHHDLVQHVIPGMSVLELGCGTAHLCPEVELRGGHYTGVDFSDQLLSGNRARHPIARFLKVGDSIAERFDLVVSLYAIEHVVNPPAYLDRLFEFTKPGGLIGIICPEFIENFGFPPSVYFGSSPRRLREKVKAFAVPDLLSHLTEWKISAPKWKRTIQQSKPGSFWINLKPTVLNGGTYTIDADAVHLVGVRDLIGYFQSKGAAVLSSSIEMKDVPQHISRFNAYVLAQRAK